MAYAVHGVASRRAGVLRHGHAGFPAGFMQVPVRPEVDGLGQAEVAKVRGVGEKAAVTRKHRARIDREPE